LGEKGRQFSNKARGTPGGVLEKSQKQTQEKKEENTREVGPPPLCGKFTGIEKEKQAGEKNRPDWPDGEGKKQQHK